MANIKYLPVGGIVTDGLQIRVKMDPDVILDYAEAMQAGKKFPPLLTFYDGESYFLADGFHRLYAARQLKLVKIACEVREGSFTDARWAACGANQEHGLRRSNPDIRRAVAVALELRPEETSRAIGAHVGVSHTIIVRARHVETDSTSNVRNPRQSDDFGPPPVPKRRIGLDGKSYPVDWGRRGVRSGAASAPPVPVRPMVSDAGGQKVEVGGEEGAYRGTDGTGDTDGSDDRGLVDSLGRHVPEDLVPLWRRRQEVQDALTTLSRLRSTLRHAQESQDPLWAETNFSSVLSHLDQAYTAVDATKPYVVCPMCQGIGCRACKERGLLGKFRYDTVIPRELKQAPRRSDGEARS